MKIDTNSAQMSLNPNRAFGDESCKVSLQFTVKFDSAEDDDKSAHAIRKHVRKHIKEVVDNI